MQTQHRPVKTGRTVYLNSGGGGGTLRLDFNQKTAIKTVNKMPPSAPNTMPTTPLSAFVVGRMLPGRPEGGGAGVMNLTEIIKRRKASFLMKPESAALIVKV